MAYDDDEQVALSAHALAALAEFTAEKQIHLARLDRLRNEANFDAPSSMDAFTEDWNESQFWYSNETASIYADQLLDGATGETVIGVLSAPSVFIALRNILRTMPPDERPRLVLFEHDHRFSLFPEFIFYDFQEPLNLPAHLKASLDRVICDPPFLSEDCQTKAALTARWLLKEASLLPRVIVSTGERMKPLVTKLYKPFFVRTTTFEPKHARGLSNEFQCYANFECSLWTWRSGAVCHDAESNTVSASSGQYDTF